MSDSYRDELIKDFTDELKSYIPRIKSTLSSLQTPQKKPALKEMHRLVHSIKGASAVVGFKGLSRVAMEWEKALEGHFSGRILFDSIFMNEMEQTLKVMEIFSDGLVRNDFDEQWYVDERIEAFENLKLKTIQVDKNENEELSVDDLLDSEEINDSDYCAESIIDSFQNNNSSPIGIKSEIQSEFLQSFYLEAEDYLYDVGRRLNHLNEDISKSSKISPEHRGQLMNIRRSIHTLKGASAVVGLERISKCAHEVENLLDYLYEEADQITPHIVETLIASLDLLENYIHNVKSIDEKREQFISESIRQFIKKEQNISEKKTQYENTNEDQEKKPIVFELAHKDENDSLERVTDEAKKNSAAETIRVDMRHIDQQTGHTDELFINHSAMDRRIRMVKKSLMELELIQDRMEAHIKSLESDFEKCISSNSSRNAFSSSEPLDPSSERLKEFETMELYRYTEFHLIVQMMRETLNDFGVFGRNIDQLNHQIDGLLNEQQQLLKDLKHDIAQIRMAPMSVITNRLHRTVRETANHLRKSVRLIIEGENIELDRRVWETLADPLMHLIRNAIDHGIESPSDRSRCGKDGIGTIILRASYRGNHILMELEDDGRGIDKENVLQQAKKNGLVSEEEEITQDEISNLVFNPGITTKERISDVSGRGIGLDIVKESILSLKGSVWVDSEGIKGTRFNLLIPLTLGSLQVILFKVSGQTYALPITEITRAARAVSEPQINNKKISVVIDSEIIPFFDLSLYLPKSESRKERRDNSKPLLILITKSGNIKKAIAIDELLGETEVIVKNLGPHIKKVKGIRGITLFGGGQIIPILNLSELLSDEKSTYSDSYINESKSYVKELEILIVDDSLSIREFTAKILATNGWCIQTARDGVDALEKIQEIIPDVIILDVEMPRMNGFEVMKVIRSHPSYNHIPVIMLTSRSAKKHKEKAKELGVQGYLVKPYKKEELTHLIMLLTGRNSQ